MDVLYVGRRSETLRRRCAWAKWEGAEDLTRRNTTLSQRRAESAVNYLITKGIDPERLGARGYGETQPAADCACARCTEGEHQTNRRTTFKVVE